MDLGVVEVGVSPREALHGSGGQTERNGDGSTSRRSRRPTAGQVSYPVPRKRERSLHTSAQDIQITRIVTI
jgi:hypothetical protein